VFVLNGDVNIFRMRNEVQQFIGGEVCKERTKSEDYQQPKKPGKRLTIQTDNDCTITAQRLWVHLLGTSIEDKMISVIY